MEPTKLKEVKIYTLEDFFVSVPPNKAVEISFAAYQKHGTYGYHYYLILPEIELYCENEKCTGNRHFKAINAEFIVDDRDTDTRFITYKCKNCERTTKEYAITIWYKDKKSGKAIKFGENPQFGPNISPKVITLIGPDREYFLSGWRAENQGMGIGAFAYYRRVVENQKTRIFNEVIKVAQKINAPAETITNLQIANKETQFTKAVEAIKVGLPEILLIDGRNPLTLLHNALSEGIHDLNDDDCLELGRAIRLVLTELAERMSQALKDQAGLSSAVSRLLKK
jgi:hypothetical protein